MGSRRRRAVHPRRAARNHHGSTGAGAQRARRADGAAIRARSTSTGSAPAGHLSPAGRTRTAPAPGSLAPLTMCFASCSHYEQGYFTAYRADRRRAPGSRSAPRRLPVRVRGGKPRAATCATRRARDDDARQLPPAVRAVQDRPGPAGRARGRAVAGGVRRPRGGEQLGRRGAARTAARVPGSRAAALQAYYENMPLRRSATPRGIDMQLYRRVRWGGLATFHMLDTRQYRDDQACGDEIRTDCTERLDPARTLTGIEQERWLLDGFQQSRARWDVLGQQVFFSQVDLTPGPGRGINPDAWDGYTAQPRPHRRRPRRLAGAQRRRPHRRRPLALGGRGARDGSTTRHRRWWRPNW